MSPDNLGPAVVTVSWIFATLSTAVVLARFYVRLRIIRSFTIDDYIIALTLLLALCNSIFLTISSFWGLGQHIEAFELQPMRKMYAIKWVYLCEFFSILSPGFGRISFAFLLLGLMPPTKAQRLFLWGIICIQFVVDIGTVIISFSQCRPINGYWDPSVRPSCWPREVQQYAAYFQSLDLILALFPTALFWNLNMEFKQKLSLSCIMGLGIFAMIASMVKTINLRSLAETYDPTYAMAELAIWWTLEANFVLLAVSIPTLRPILKPSRIFTRSGSDPSTDVNAYNLKKRNQGDSNPSNPKPFERFHDYAAATEARNSNNSYQYNEASGHTMDRASLTGDLSHTQEGIRKDITCYQSRLQ
ncbi:uncharacterized protein F4807DRAFT_472677 [Annulohypoxylon truncatum]|uniref:uncharacterized protein n=1 Tax=Annulohypoxylon truncatum TaxID=327061 RepID=UPI00200870A1|nr:uncharacterized protein F4807DRAFT_472677 [Annulohypoxylon truncatum]KAI1204110.1 integral membrane protein [Annulohypoxylon truncatum]